MPKFGAALLGCALLMASAPGCHPSKDGDGDIAAILEIYGSDYKMHSQDEKKLVAMLAKNLSPLELKQAIIAIENEKISMLKAIDKTVLFQYRSNLQALKPEAQASVKTSFDICMSNLMEGPLIDLQARERIVKALQSWSPGKSAKDSFPQ